MSHLVDCIVRYTENGIRRELLTPETLAAAEASDDPRWFVTKMPRETHYVIWRSHGDADFITTELEVGPDSTTLSGNVLMARCVRKEFEKGGAYHLEEPDPEWTAQHQIEDNISHGYDLVTSFVSADALFHL